MTQPRRTSAFAPFQWPDFRHLFACTACSTFASRALLIVLTYQLYDLTNSKLALGLLGLVEAIPSLSLALYGGHVADRRDRRRILQVTLSVLICCACTLALLAHRNAAPRSPENRLVQTVLTTGSAVSGNPANSHAPARPLTDAQRMQILVMFLVVFVAGIAKGFAEPAASALEAQVVPWSQLISCSTLMASCWLSSGVIGPIWGGLAFAFAGPAWTYLSIAGFYAFALISIRGLTPKPIPVTPPGESVWESVSIGVRYVWGDQILLGSMALDLFAVLFGGAIALLPVFAKDILHVGTIGLGFLNAAPQVGALLTMLWATQRPPVKHAGRNLFLSVTAFGIAMIVFALSQSIYLSIAALFFSGVFDGISVIIRRSILRLLSPEHLRGRIASVSMIFIGSSNELGAFESGLAASLLGTVTSVWTGAVVTLLVVAVAAIRAPKLRRLSLDPDQVVRRDAEVDELLDENAASGLEPDAL